MTTHNGTNMTKLSGAQHRVGNGITFGDWR